MKKRILGTLILLLTGCAVHVPNPQLGTVVPVIVHNDGTLLNTPIFVCRIKPFTREYRSEHPSRGLAKLDVQKQCLANHNEMFCQEKDIICKPYN
ncbi:hypothetical protein ACFQ02_04605 [Seminibacterium arietis]|uniref:Lipoprotein n=1 Tax=Seminibacterium arietis TaxID=1173502 RepID=A0ABW3I8D1_9PAST